MADSYQSKQGYVTSTTGLVISGIAPGTGVDGFDSVNITYANLFNAVNTSITNNANNISALSSRVDDVENINTRVQRQDDNADFTITQPEYSALTLFGFLTKSGTPVVSVGTTLGGDDIVSEVTITDGFSLHDLLSFADETRTIYVSISGGVVDVTYEMKLLIFNI